LRLILIKRITWLVIGTGVALAVLSLVLNFGTSNPADSPSLHIAYQGTQTDSWFLVSCDDFPGFWSRFEKSPAGKSLRREADFLLEAPRLSLRKITGIRFTPLRWRLWLGRRVVFGWCPDGEWFLAAQGGPLYRAIGRYLFAQSPTPVQKTSSASTYLLQWHPEWGYCIFASEQAFKGFNEIKKDLKKQKTLQININPELNFEGIYRLTEPHTVTTLTDQPSVTLSSILSQRNKSSISVQGSIQFLVNLSVEKTIKNDKKIYKSLFAVFLNQNWKEGYCFDLEVQDGIPVPDIVLAGDALDIPAWAEKYNLSIRSRSFGSYEGWEIALFPPWLTGYVAQVGDVQVFATSASRLADILDGLSFLPDSSREVSQPGNRLSLRVNWLRLAKPIQKLLPVMAENHMLMGISDPRELDLHWFPLLKWIKTLGETLLEVSPAGADTWRIEGHICSVSSDQGG